MSGTGEHEASAESRAKGREELASDLCADIEEAAELVELAKKLSTTAMRRASEATQKTMFGLAPCQFRVGLTANPAYERQEVYLTRDDHVLDDDPNGFVATEVRSISEHGVEFYNRDTDTWLRVKGFEFRLDPVLDQETTPPAS